MSTEIDAVLRPEFRGYFEGLAAGTIQFPFCASCERFHWYPLPLCPHCGGSSVEWRAVSGKGCLWSWTEVRHAYVPSLRERLPYFVALVTFEDAPGVRLLTNLVGHTQNLRIDMDVFPVFGEWSPGKPRVLFSTHRVG